MSHGDRGWGRPEGPPLVLVDGAERYLALIERHRVTSTQLVPTMFSRLLKLPAEVRARYDLSSLRLLGSVGEHVYFEPVLRCEFGYNVHIGDRFYANFDCVLLDGADITIGDDVLFGPRVAIYTANHALDPAERAAGACYAKPVHIGSNVWIGGGVNINQGVTIGDGAVIGSGSVITGDVPARVVAAGVPATVRRDITDASTAVQQQG